MATSSRYAQDQPHGFSNRIEKVAVTGAGGRMGSLITKALLGTSKHAVTAITRPNSDTTSFPAGVNIIQVDYSGDDDTALVSGLRGQQALIITAAVTAPRDMIPKLIRAAAKAGVKYVLPNWYGQDAANQSLCDDSLLTPMRDSILAEFAALEPNSTAYFLLYCNFWYEFSLGGGPDRFGFDFQKRSLILFDKGDVAINVTTWPQCARAVANLLSLKELPDDATDKSPTISQFANKGVYVSSFLLTQKEMFESVKRVTNTSDNDWAISTESSEQRWRESRDAVHQGNIEPFAKLLYSRNFFPNGGGDYESQLQLQNDVLSLPKEDLDEATAEAVRIGVRGDVVKAHKARVKEWTSS
ncbi:NAD(P)-binding protein [Cryphonectria parasitica EP155]|uniref:NAD(P)-binding protein n=1 Tax=Cryphonectria parasitica (strain ATCC 38755 / EP155) TaxID=660469 RepID=A0A9P4Y1Y5_CRYP1|nr:NAD(P)-binding protein [Cryphonectria parasitica EP155]KAF3764670.1 NAD(P)-binding protein [Cryphonectria parasitica EP155]